MCYDFDRFKAGGITPMPPVPYQPDSCEWDRFLTPIRPLHRHLSLLPEQRYGRRATN